MFVGGAIVPSRLVLAGLEQPGYVEAAVSLCPPQSWATRKVNVNMFVGGAIAPSYLALAGLEQPDVNVEAAVSLCPTSKLSYTESECEHVCWRCYSAKPPRVGRRQAASRWQGWNNQAFMWKLQSVSVLPQSWATRKVNVNIFVGGAIAPSRLVLAGLEQPGVYVEAAVSLRPTSKLGYTESECEHVCWRCYSAKPPRVGRVGTTRRLCGSCSQSLSYLKVGLHGK
ncbi:hypothetical protein J6590_031029 [Homalodisca vitripennis]|nr:hypothetical protein J6590_031029 [Homalodisca vitripennis]